MIDQDKLSIELYLHCKKCMKDFKDHKYKGESMATMSRYDVGWTEHGLQVWCRRHDCNIEHIDLREVDRIEN